MDRLQSDFGQNYHKAFSELQKLIISHESFRNNRIIRAIIYLGNKDIVQLEKHIKQAKTDWRDILLWAEYDNKENRLGDFNNKFGKEK
ncbi:hypothetical protein GCM10022393_29790 [Aquimarina addita]|uniref:Uncharacterized protein n=1 Tax=Aquimarina addita TaxID=870485 RepID=A0ABP6URT5_9FLAO